MTVCFKKIDPNYEIYFHCVKNTSSRWTHANRQDVNCEESDIFIDDNNNRHLLKHILYIGKNDNTLSSLWIMGGADDDIDDADAIPIKVSNPVEIEKIINYLDQNKCNKQ